MLLEGVSSEILTLQRAWSGGGPGPLEWLYETQRKIAALDRAGPALNAVLEWNPGAEAEAAALEREAAVSGRRGPLHGVPVLLKDNIDTSDGTHTSAGALALGDRFAPADAFVAARLRAAGAVLCGKANMTELANFMTKDMPNGYSSRGGQVRHAWKESADASGSSTGPAVAVAAGYVPLAVGTETCGSIISPSAANGAVGLKPTVGLVSRAGVIPIAPSQDTAGPIGRTVADCALAFRAMAGFDPADPATGAARGRAAPGGECCLPRPEGLRGFRIGLYPLDENDKPIASGGNAFFSAVDALKALGAEVLPFSPPKGLAEGMLTVLTHEFRPAMDAALRRDAGPVRTLRDIARFNEAHAEDCLRYGQTWVEAALALPRPMLTQDYFDARGVARRALHELHRLFAEQRLDAVVSMCGLVAFPVTGCPALTLPVGWNAAEGLPVPMTFNGLPFSEGRLLAAASALERALGPILPKYCRND
jgi:amidase